MPNLEPGQGRRMGKKLMWHPNPSHGQKLEAHALPHHPMHGGIHGAAPCLWLAAGGPRRVLRVPDARNPFAPTSSLGLVMLGVAQGNKNWLSSEEEKK